MICSMCLPTMEQFFEVESHKVLHKEWAQVYTPAQKERKRNLKKPPKPSLPLLEVADLPPPHPDEPIVDTFDPLGSIKEGNPDEPLGGTVAHVEEN